MLFLEECSIGCHFASWSSLESSSLLKARGCCRLLLLLLLGGVLPRIDNGPRTA